MLLLLQLLLPALTISPAAARHLLKPKRSELNRAPSGESMEREGGRRSRGPRRLRGRSVLRRRT